MQWRRRRLVAVLVVLAVGYLLVGGGPLVGGGGQQQDFEPYPEPPDRLTNESAIGVAVQHERAYVDRELGTNGKVQSYVVGSTVTGREASVLARNETGVYVRVKQPFGYSTRSADGDGRTNTTYLVTESAVDVVFRDQGAYV